MNDYEMSYLNWLEKEYPIKRIVHSVQKVYRLLNFLDSDTHIDFANTVNVCSLSLEEDIFLEKASELLGVNVKSYDEYSLVFKRDKTIYKIFYLYDQDFKYIDQTFQMFDPIHKEDIETRMFIIGKQVVEDRALTIEFFTMLAINLFNDYTNTTGIDLMGSPADHYCGSGASLRRCIDYFIIIFRTLDGIVDLKFDDWENVQETLFGYIEIDRLTRVYEFAIRTDVTEKDYCDMVEATLNEYEFDSNFMLNFKDLAGLIEEEN